MICLGGRVIGIKIAEELISAFLNAKFIGAERHKRRLDKIKALEEARS
jgi:ribose 5-phosphate isomerase B